MRRDPREQHVFKPREHGSSLACGYPGCGAAEDDPVHIRVPKPTQPHPWRKPRGQAMVEFAMILPLLLLLLVGMVWVSLRLRMGDDLAHAAREGAIAGATNPGDSCGVAETSARKVYPGTLETVACRVNGQTIEVTLTDTLAFEAPGLTAWNTGSSTQRAVLR